MVLPYGILAYKFLYNPSISDLNERLIQANLTDLTYETMKTQLKKIFGVLSLSVVSNKAQNTHTMLEGAGEIVYEATHDEVEEQVHYGHHKNGGHDIQTSEEEVVYVSRKAKPPPKNHHTKVNRSKRQ